MRRFFAISIVVFSIILASNVQAGGIFQKLYFVGLWEGIDPNDGFEAQYSITLNSDGTFNIIGRESYTFGCDGPGMIEAEGVVFKDGVITSEEFFLKCYNVEDKEFDKTIQFQTTYKPDKLNGTLIMGTEGSNFLPGILHKISNR